VTKTKEELVNQRLGKTIARRRKAAGFTQDEVAERLDIGKEAFSRLERGIAGASVYRLFELADMFECGVETFVIEGSRRVTEQVELIDRFISGLSTADRQLVVQIVERLARRFKVDAKKERTEEEGPGYWLE
jgi:transcriptional regulator with XRE-family HTH domain